MIDTYSFLFIGDQTNDLQHVGEKMGEKKQIYICIYAFSRHFYPKRFTVYSGYTFFISMCVPWELKPKTFCTGNNYIVCVNLTNKQPPRNHLSTP